MENSTLKKMKPPLSKSNSQFGFQTRPISCDQTESTYLLASRANEMRISELSSNSAAIKRSHIKLYLYYQKTDSLISDVRILEPNLHTAFENTGFCQASEFALEIGQNIPFFSEILLQTNEGQTGHNNHWIESFKENKR